MMKKRGRPKITYPNKRAALVRAAYELFRGQGFAKVTIDLICRHADTTKMTFYRHFRDKEDLATQIVQQRMQEECLAVEGILALSEPFAVKFTLVLQRHEHLRHDLGLEFVDELLQSSEADSRSLLATAGAQVKALNLQFIKQGKDEGFFRSEIDDEFFLFLVDKINSFFKDPTLKMLYPNLDVRFRALSDFLYYGVTKKDVP